jgi:hypothetical protein
MTEQEDKNIPKCGKFDGHTTQVKAARRFKESVLGLISGGAELF